MPLPFGPSYTLAIIKSYNISRKKLKYKLHNFWKFGLINLKVMSEDSVLKRGGITKVHCIFEH